MTSQFPDYGVTNWDQFQFPALPQDAPTQSADFGGDSFDYGGTPEYNKYSDTARPVVVRSKIWDNNGFYLNGPTYQPWARAKSEVDAIDALTQSWADPARSAMVKRFMRYVGQYGSTNSAGVLWGLAQVNIDQESDVVQQLLKADAEAVQEENRQSQPMRANSVVANEYEPPSDGGFFDTLFQGGSELWDAGLDAVQFAARNVFALGSSGMEAVQGVMRSAGGALTDDDASIIDKYAAIMGSTMGFVSGPLSTLVAPDSADVENPFNNPWAQTDWGQTLSLARSIGWEAFTTAQAGLDVKTAAEQLGQTDPEFYNLSQEEQTAVAEKYAQENNIYAKSGWFVDETSIVGERQRRATFNTWAIPGPDDQLTAWTLGRGIASNTVGTDSEAYGVVSGLTDAAAAIFTDPLTYIPALGLPSKAASAATRGAWLFGMEANKARRLTEVINTGLQKAQKAKADGDLAASERELYGALRSMLNRAPTQEEFNIARANLDSYVDPTDLGKMTDEELAQMTKAAREAELVSAHLEAAKVDKGAVGRAIRSARRDALEADSVERFVSTGVKPTGGGQQAQESATAWNDFLAWGENNPGATFDDFAASQYGINRLTGEPVSPDVTPDFEGWARFAQVSDLWRVFAAQRQSQGISMTDSLADFSTVLQNAAQDTRSLKRFKQIDDATVESDIGRMLVVGDEASGLVGDSIEKRLQELSDADYHGIIVDGIPEANVPMFGAYGPDAGVFYLTTARNSKLNVVSANDVVPENIRTRVVSRLMEVLERPDMRIDDGGLASIVDYETILGQVYRRYDEATDPRGFISRMGDKEALTYNELLENARFVGLDAVLDDILRTAVRGKRIDGITDVGGVTGRTWLGNTTRVTGYGISDDVRVAATNMRNAVDPEVELLAQGLSDGTVTRLGYQALTPADLDVAAARSRQAAEDGVTTLLSKRSDDLFNANRQQLELRNQLDDLDAEWADPVAKFKSVFGWHAGLRRHPVNGFTTDEKGVRAFLFGMGPMSALGNKALDAIADFVPESARLKALEGGPDSTDYLVTMRDAVGQLRIVTNNKWSDDLYMKVAENAVNGGGKAGLVDILAPRIGVDVSMGDISKTIRSSGKDGKSWVSSYRTKHPKITRMLGQMPTPTKVNLQDSRAVTDAILTYGRYAGLDEATMAKFIGEVTMDAGTAVAGLTARHALLRTFNAISETLINNIESSKTTKFIFAGKGGERRKKEIINAIHDSTRLYFGGKIKTVEQEYLAESIAKGSDLKRVTLADGSFYNLPDAKLDSELADGFIGLPSVEEWADGLRTITRALDRSELVGKSWRAALQFYNNFFRTSLLVFRGAYLIRNLAEMQVRMFLNGHESVFNDPVTMLAMTIGDNRWAKKMVKYNATREEARNSLIRQLDRKPTEDEILAIAGSAPTKPKLLETFDRYSNTVLDTSFNTGLDAELAAANHVTEFFDLIRNANSLTDPRVYNSGVKQSWVPVEFGSPNFNKGWANELILLQRSEIAQAVVGNTTTRQFESIMGGTATGDVQKALIDELMYHPKYEKLRRKMIAADDAYMDIFTDAGAMREYLFDNRNSIFNKIRDLTNGDERLIGFIRTGKLALPDGTTFAPNSITDLRKRISQFRVELDKHFSDESFAQAFREREVRVPYIDQIDVDTKKGIGLVNKFFQVSARIERLGAVGPEFRMAYWDRIADLAPALRGSDIERALKAARTTLSPIQSLSGKKIGRAHPAWNALDKAKSNGNDGFMTLDQLHEVAMQHAADEVSKLFYDAAKRNNLWYGLRVIIPFGQAWGNTLATWSKLGAKKPINIYKAQKLFNALQEEQSNAIYEAGQQFGPLSMYGEYSPGMAPWEKDTQGGFFYSNDYGDTVFQFPLAGRALGMSANLLARLNFVDAGPVSNAAMSVESPVSSLNLALGGDNISPGFSPVVGFPLSSDLLPDNKMTSWLRQQVAPFGDKNIVESGSPAWLQKVVGGAQGVPIIGQGLSMLTGSLYPGQKNRAINDALAILSTSGNYADAMSNPLTAQRMKQDAEELAAAMMLMTGLFQNVMPSTPITEPVITGQIGGLESQTTAQYTLGLVNALYQQYYVRNGFDSAAAREEILQDFGPYAAFAMVGNWSGFTRLPTTQALDWAYDNPDVAEANRDIFPLFFPQGDSSSVEALRWLRYNTFEEQERKNPDEAFAEAVSFLKQVQLNRINSMEANDQISADVASEKRDEINKRYMAVDEAAGTFLNRTLELEKINKFVTDNASVQASDAGTAFQIAWDLRGKALTQVKAYTNDPDAGLGSMRAAPIRVAYMQQLDKLVEQYPDFKLLADRLRKEWD